MQVIFFQCGKSHYYIIPDSHTSSEFLWHRHTVSKDSGTIDQAMQTTKVFKPTYFFVNRVNVGSLVASEYLRTDRMRNNNAERIALGVKVLIT